MIAILAAIGAGSTVLAAIAIIMLIRLDGNASERAWDAISARSVAERGQLLAERQRDEANAKAAAAEESTARAFAQLSAAQTNANAARAALVAHVREQVAGSDSDVGAVVDGLLQAHLPGAGPVASKPASASDGAGGATPVHPAAATGAPDHRRP